MLWKIYSLSLISIVELFSNNVHVHYFRIQLHMDNSKANCNGEILNFWNSDMTTILLMKTTSKSFVKLNTMLYKSSLLSLLFMPSARIN